MLKHILAAMLLIVSVQAAQAQDNIVVVLDTSRSMETNMRIARKSRIDVAQEALSDVLSNLSSSTKIGILTFNGWAYDFGPVDSTRLKASISSTRTSGSTPLWAHMKVAADKLLQVRQANNNVGRYKIVVVTDGEAGDENLAADNDWRGNPKEVPGYLTDIMNRGIIVDANGLDMKGDHSLSNRINGSYMRGDDPSSFKESVKKAVAEIKFDDAGGDSDEVFEMLNQLPDDFTYAVVKGLSVFHNQPIGQAPPPVILVEETGEVIQDTNADPVAQDYSTADDAKSGGFGFLLLGFMFVVFIIVVGIFAATRR